MSLPQHIGDLIFPHPSGHVEIFTVLPSSLVITSGTKALPQAAHVKQLTFHSQLSKCMLSLNTPNFIYVYNDTRFYLKINLDFYTQMNKKIL